MARSFFLPIAFSGLLAFVQHAAGAVIDSNTTIDASNSFPGESVFVRDGVNPPTIVNILPGAVIGPTSNAALFVFDTSVANIFGGAIHGRIHIGQDATVNLIDLDPEAKVRGVSISENATFNMSGGEVGDMFSSDGVKALEDSPTLNISGGLIHNALETQKAARATVHFTGGEIKGSLRVMGNSTAHLWGGSITRTSVWDNSQLHVYGFGLAIDEDCDCRLAGRLADGSAVDFEILIVPQGGTASIILHEVTDTPGDSFPLDGTVDIDDLNRVRNHFGTGQMGGDPRTGDTFPFDGIVDINDLNRVRNHFGATRPPLPVPEPAAGALLLGAVASCLTLRAPRPNATGQN
jgi:hypothetical protein